VRSIRSLTPPTSRACLPCERARSVRPQRLVIRRSPPKSTEDKVVACGEVFLGRTPWELTPLSPPEVFRLLHAGKDGVVTFHNCRDEQGGPVNDKRETRWNEYLGAMATNDVDLARLGQHGQFDAYFSINSLIPRRWKQLAMLTGLPIHKRNAGSIKWINALKLDVDRHDDQHFHFPALFEEVQQHNQRVGLPRPNLICSSGRGLWFLWLLCDWTDRSQLIRGWPDKVELAHRINIGLIDAFAQMRPDRKVYDAARVMRIPGSINTKAALGHEVVQFYLGSIDRHTLPELAAVLGIHAQKTKTSSRVGEKDLAKQAAGFARWQIPYDGILQLGQLRAGFSEGRRHVALWLIALHGRRSHVPDNELFEKLLDVAQSCRPPLGLIDLKRALASGTKSANRDFRQSIGNVAITRLLRISETEKAQLTAWFRPSKALARRCCIQERRSKVLAILQLARRKLSCREVSLLLLERYGIHVSWVTISKDLYSLRNDLSTPPVNLPSASKRSSATAPATQNLTLARTGAPFAKPKAQRKPCDETNQQDLFPASELARSSRGWTDPEEQTRPPRFMSPRSRLKRRNA
jgi:hypothetical protein